MKSKTKKVLKNVTLGLLVVGAVGGTVALGSKIVDEVKDPSNTIHPTFEVGGLVTETGRFEDNLDTIYTKDAFSAKGLEVKLDFDSKVKYQVFFYDELDNFINATEVFETSKDISVPIKAKARLEVTPIKGPEDPVNMEIKWHDVHKYSSQIEINVDKRQELIQSDFKAYSLTDTTMFTKNVSKSFTKDSLKLVENSQYTCYEMTNNDYSCMYLKLLNNKTFSDGIILYVVDGDKCEEYSSSDLTSTNIENTINLNKNTKLYLNYYNTLPIEKDINMMFYFA